MTTERSAPERAVMDVLRQTVQTSTAGTVFGEPITRGEVTVIPVARVSGRGGGGGGGGGPDSRDHAAGGSGAGVVLSARPVGVFVIRGGKVRWRPALDLNKVIFGGQVVGLAVLLTVRAFLRSRHG